MSTYEYLGVGQEDGTIVGRSATDLVGFHGTAPSDQRAVTAAVSTSGAITSTGAYGYSETQANALVGAVNEILALLKEKGLMASS